MFQLEKNIKLNLSNSLSCRTHCKQINLERMLMFYMETESRKMLEYDGLGERVDHSEDFEFFLLIINNSRGKATIPNVSSEKNWVL